MALTEIEFAQKATDGTLTFAEAWEFGKSQATPAAKKRINALKSGFDKMGLDFNMLYKDLKDPEVLKLFRKETSPDKSSRAGNLQGLETAIEPTFKKFSINLLTEEVGDGLKQPMYPTLAGAGAPAGTQRTGLAGERPMRGLLPMEDFTKIYAEAVPLIQKEFGDATADLIRYHATTANRPEQLQRLKKSDVTISGSTITVRGKPKTKLDKKGRPELSFDLNSSTGQLLKRNLDSSKSDFLFDTTDAKFTTAFNKHVGSRLEAFSNVLPLAETKIEGPDGVQLSEKPVTTPSAVRSIVPKIMLDQFNVPEALVQGAMGHVNTTILRKNYAGLQPSTDLPKLLEDPASFAVGDFGTNQKNINLDLLSAADKKELVEEQKLTLITEEKKRRAEADAATAKAEADKVKANLSVTPEDIAKSAQIDQAKIEADELAKIETQRIQKATRDKVKLQVQEDAKINSADDLSNKLKSKLSKFGIELGSKTLKSLPFIGAAYTAPESYRVVKEATESITGPGILPTIAGSAAAASEFVSPLAASDIQEVKQAAPNILSAEQGRIDELRQRGRDRAGMNAGDGVAPPDDNFLTMQP